MEPRANPATLADQLAANRRRQACSHADARREYDRILSRAATPQPDDAVRLHDLAMEQGIAEADLAIDVRRAVAEHEHRQRVEASEAKHRGLTDEIETLQHRRAEYAALLELLGGDAAGLIRAVQAAIVSRGPEREDFVEKYLLCRNWSRRGIGGWSDPLRPGPVVRLCAARNIQLNRDIEPLRAEVMKQLHEEASRVEAAAAQAPAVATA